MSQPDLSASIDILIAAARAAIGDFVVEHPDNTVCYFGFDATPEEGEVLISIDTLENREFLSESASHTAPRIGTFVARPNKQSRQIATPIEFGEFDLIGYRRIEIPEWAAAAQACDDEEEEEDDPIDALVTEAKRVMFVALDALFNERAFAGMRLSADCAIGYVTHQDMEASTTHHLGNTAI